MSERALCHLLDWDTHFFGFRVARLQESRPAPESLRKALEWCRESGVRCLYFLADSDEERLIRLAEANRFRLADIRVTFERSLRDSPLRGADEDLPVVFRAARAEDLPYLSELARGSHTDTRFYHDSNFPRDRCDALYETWIRKSVEGDADLVLVPEMSGRIVGYLSCHIDPAQDASHATGRIGIVGLGPEAQGQGIGQRLVREALRWFSEQGVAKVTVVTQGRNRRAQRLYGRCGFLSDSMQLWYHRWFNSHSTEAGP